MSKTIIIGITGKTAAGKSTIGRYVKDKISDSLFVDVDKVAKDIYCKNQDIRIKLVKFFGENTCSADGKVNYATLARKVFSSKKELTRLNDLMFPLIEQEIRKIIESNTDKKYIIIDAAILFDSELYKLCSYIINVKADRERRAAFLKSKNKHFPVGDIEMRLEGQHIKTIKKLIDFEITNYSSLEELYGQADEIISMIKQKNKDL